MMPCHRGEAPDLLQRFGAEVGQEYAAKRRENPTHQFRWPQREGQSLYTVAHEALKRMTAGRCPYCDADAITATGKEEIDHFRPKTREEFYELVCAWDNLLLACSACNKAKLDQWDEALLRPDEDGYDFPRFFSYRADTGELEPNPAAPRPHQHRAQQTIQIFGLNRAGACEARRRVVRMMLAASSEEDWAEFGYRFLSPLLRDV